VETNPPRALTGINNNMEIINLLYDQYYNGSSKVPTAE
jgi:hypothetical protein